MVSLSSLCALSVTTQLHTMLDGQILRVSRVTRQGSKRAARISTPHGSAFHAPDLSKTTTGSASDLGPPPS